MNKIAEIIGEISILKRKKKFNNTFLAKELNVTKYQVEQALKGTGRIDVLSKIYDYCKNN